MPMENYNWHTTDSKAAEYGNEWEKDQSTGQVDNLRLAPRICLKKAVLDLDVYNTDIYCFDKRL